MIIKVHWLDIGGGLGQFLDLTPEELDAEAALKDILQGEPWRYKKLKLTNHIQYDKIMRKTS